MDNITAALARVGPPTTAARPPGPYRRRTAAPTPPPLQRPRHTERKARQMATFSAEVFQNEFLPDGGTDVHAIVTVTCSGAGEAGQSDSGDAGEIVIVDTSGSMGGDKIIAVQQAAAAALDQMLDGVWFAVIAGSHAATLAFPLPGARAWCGWTRRRVPRPRLRWAASGPTAAPPWAPG